MNLDPLDTDTTRMINSLQLSQFRGIESVSFDKLGGVNLIVGGNNTGKTSLLEALVLLFGNHEQLQQLPSQFRQSANEKDDWAHFWNNLIRDKQYDTFCIAEEAITLQIEKGSDEDIQFFRKERSSESSDQARKNREGPIVVIRPPSNGRVDAGHSTPKKRISVLSTTQPDPRTTSALFNEVAPLNPENETRIQDLLRSSIEPRLKQLRYAKPKGTREHLVYVGLGSGEMVPFTQMGEAFARALHIYCEIFSQRPDILLIDEIENGLYYAGLEKYWKGLFSVLEQEKVQLFATTHSRECMEAAQQADAKHGQSMLRYLRLDRDADDLDKITGTSFGSDTMAGAIEFGREMR